MPRASVKGKIVVVIVWQEFFDNNTRPEDEQGLKKTEAKRPHRRALAGSRRRRVKIRIAKMGRDKIVVSKTIQWCMKAAKRLSLDRRQARRTRLGEADGKLKWAKDHDKTG